MGQDSDTVGQRQDRNLSTNFPNATFGQTRKKEATDSSRQDGASCATNFNNPPSSARKTTNQPPLRPLTPLAMNLGAVLDAAIGDAMGHPNGFIAFLPRNFRSIRPKRRHQVRALLGALKAAGSRLHRRRTQMAEVVLRTLLDAAHRSRRCDDTHGRRALSRGRRIRKADIARRATPACPVAVGSRLSALLVERSWRRGGRRLWLRDAGVPFGANFRRRSEQSGSTGPSSIPSSRIAIRCAWLHRAAMAVGMAAHPPTANRLTSSRPKWSRRHVDTVLALPP